MADGVNPTVDLNLGPAPTAPANPIASAGGIVGIMSDLAEMRNRQNANILFQQQMSARHQLGEDLSVWSAQGLSPQEQQDRAAHQTYAPFVTDAIASLRQSSLAGTEISKNQTEIAEVHQRMINSGLGTLAQTLAATGGDPSKFDNAFKIATAGYPPELQGDMAKVYPAIKQSLIGGTERMSPEAAKAKVIENTRNLGLPFGLDLAKGYAISNNIPPAAVVVPGGGMGQIGGQGPGVTPPLVPVQPNSGGATSPALGTPGAASVKALDGSPLFAPDSALPPQFKANLTGTKAFQSTQAESIADEAAKQWQTDQPRYEQIAQSNATIGNMLDEFRTSARGGGMLTSGFMGESRAMMANAVNTAYAWFNPGAAPPLDPTKLAAAEAESKNAHQLAFQVVSQATGQSREALGTLQMGYNSIPNMDRTPLGNVVVGEVIQATGNWLLQKQQFERDWMSRTGGDLTNAEAEYLKEHPPEKVMSAALGAHGIGPNGYTSRAAFLRDFHDGLLTSGKEAPLETAATIAHQKGWITDDQFKAAKAGGFKTLDKGTSQ